MKTHTSLHIYQHIHAATEEMIHSERVQLNNYGRKTNIHKTMATSMPYPGLMCSCSKRHLVLVLKTSQNTVQSMASGLVHNRQRSLDQPQTPNDITPHINDMFLYCLRQRALSRSHTANKRQPVLAVTSQKLHTPEGLRRKVALSVLYCKQTAELLLSADL